MKNNLKKAFTLIELLVTLGLLTAGSIALTLVIVAIVYMVRHM